MPAFQTYDERTAEKVDGGTAMKPLDEIKKGLEIYSPEEIKEIMQSKGFIYSQEQLHRSALAYIQQLEAQNAELKRELGKAVMALATCAMDGLDGNICNYCTHKNCDEQDLHFECFEWRGLCKENGGTIGNV